MAPRVTKSSKQKKKPEPVTINVRAGAFPGGKVTEYTFPEGSKVNDVLKRAGFDPSSGTVRLNGQSLSSMEVEVNDGDQVLVFSNVRGN